MGRAIGTTGCVGDCLNRWRPFAATAEDQPSGYWDIVIREDGTRQWAYKGYPLYTFFGDKKPCDLLSEDVYEYRFNDGLHNTNYVQPPGPAGVALDATAPTAFAVYWTYAYP